MTDYFTIKIPEDEGERHNERRQDLGLSWAEYIDGEAPEEPAWIDGLRDELRNGGEADGVPPGIIEVHEATEEELAEIKRRLSAVETVEERTGRIEQMLERLGAGR